MIDEERLLERLPYWNDLIELDRARVRSSACVRRFRKGQLLYSAGCDCLGMMLVPSGDVRVYIVSEEGREITLFHLREGDTCVLSASCAISQITFETAMVAREDTELIVIPSGEYEQLMAENIKVRCFTYELLAERASTIMWVLQQILFKRLDQRVAECLLADMERTGSATLHINQEGIAEQINSAREAVTRQLSRFSDEGLVEAGRGRVRILNPQGLAGLLGR
ncbi:MAG: Crp/Fnr family transcriptional regulator [Coriobacteriales bacterium]|jgi:CRP/FNR family transcriptional regulator